MRVANKASIHFDTWCDAWAGHLGRVKCEKEGFSKPPGWPRWSFLVGLNNSAHNHGIIAQIGWIVARIQAMQMAVVVLSHAIRVRAG